jgi:YD repeat-containing protein
VAPFDNTQGATNLNTYSYNYDFLSRLSSVTSTAEGTTDFSYYDDSQLKSATGTQTSQNYSYDANGNRNMTGYSTIADNRTTVDPNFNYIYDAEGNITRKTNKTTLQVIAEYEWDHRNRLTRVALGSIRVRPGSDPIATSNGLHSNCESRDMLHLAPGTHHRG